eukprot:SAG11_NODE_114_length_16040_cov_10.050875_22_plen_63_part_00
MGFFVRSSRHLEVGARRFGNSRFLAERRFRARVDPLAFSRFWAFSENFEGGGELEPSLFPLL